MPPAITGKNWQWYDFQQNDCYLRRYWLHKRRWNGCRNIVYNIMACYSSFFCTNTRTGGFFLVVMVAGIIVANRLESLWGKDSNKIVVDEVAGMCCTLLFVPHNWKFALAGLVLFRFFDIVKPLYISAAEKLPGGWGVMTDDVVAGVYANLLLQVIVATNIF